MSSTHLSGDALVELAQAGESHPHVAECDRCRRAFEDVRDALNLVRAEQVPEPSPLFWDHLSARVHEAVQHEAPLRPRRAVWFTTPRWRSAVAVALTVLVVAVVARALRPAGAPASRPGPAQTTQLPVAVPETSRTAQEPPTEESTDASWTLVTELASNADLDTTTRAEGFALQPGAAERAALQLTPDEQRELVRLLQAAVERPE
jgi:hypothetical protein